MANRKEELIIAQTAKAKLEAAIRSELSRFKRNNLSEKNREDLKNFQIRIDGNDWKGKNGDEFYFLNQLALVMSVHGFVQHYGSNASSRKKGMRKRHVVRRKTEGFTEHYYRKKLHKVPAFTKYYRKKHDYELTPTGFITKALRNSGALNYTLENITRIRGEQMFLSSFLPLSDLK